MTLAITVCLKPVPSEESAQKITIDPVSKIIDRGNSESVINPLDLNALEAAVRLKEQCGAKITVVAMAPLSAVINLRQALALGADCAYLVSDPAFAGSDTLATSYILACAIKKTGLPDLVLCGNNSADGGTAQVPAQLGEWLEIPHFHNVFALKYQDELLEIKSNDDHTYLEWRVGLPLVLSVERQLNKPRYITFKGIKQAKSKEITTLTLADLDCDSSFIGLAGSPTQMGELIEFSFNRHGEKFTGDAQEIAAKLIDRLSRCGVKI